MKPAFIVLGVLGLVWLSLRLFKNKVGDEFLANWDTDERRRLMLKAEEEYARMVGI